MSGICAVWRKHDPGGIAAMLTAVNAGLHGSADERSVQEVADRAGVAVQARFHSQQIIRNGRVLLVCDADLLNENELSSAVAQAGERPTTAALLATMYERDGDRFVEKLRGGFSVILWDLAERRLFAAIDGFGIKRLAWFDDGKVVLIASRADALRAGGDNLRDNLRINPRAIANVLNFSANLAPETIFTGVQRLLPGQFLSASERQTRTESYWDMRYGTGAGLSEAQLGAELESVLEESVAAHCAGDRSPVSGLSRRRDRTAPSWIDEPGGSRGPVSVLHRLRRAAVQRAGIRGHRARAFRRTHLSE